MAYNSVWERLNQAAKRVMDATGCGEEEAQADICGAVADRVIAFRCRLKKQATGPMTSKSVLEGAAFDIPTTISPDDLDWEQSRPLKPWIVRRGSYSLPGHWHLECIELSNTDVTRVLCAPRAGGDAKLPSFNAKQRTPKGRPNLERAKRVIDELYPGGPPDQADLPNKQFCAQVHAKLKGLNLADVSDDTILRAAGRRRN
jgi:hypothetical protein